ncbi:hypothetical protein N657DRAFT_640226 [Parathielavia appendiculata]|uniref:Uncharacterized protein n=1 Tax=Parathielavia appendiculata TaxID=2587402 RepID=A0AAN6Z967_9PEZI|nr:hypothetical protein N657DRAFT_640226 [Parathielavia appendiculata]
MASPIGYLIHPEHPTAAPDVTPPVHPAPAFRAPLIATPEEPVRPHGPTSAPPSSARTDPERTTTGPAPDGNHAKTKSLYQCADCLRRYSRPEHLQRHVAAHTLGKRFTCDVCSKAFARADLLKRHRANHQADSSNKRRRFNSAPSASRVAQACAPCAKARVKCEEIKPCTRCKTRRLTCEVASSEDAARSLAHLSGTRAERHESTPESCYSFSSSLGQRLPRPPTSTPSSYVPSASPEDSKESIAAPAYPMYQDDPLPTSDASPTPGDQANADDFSSYPNDDLTYGGQDQPRVQFPDFLRDVLYDQSFGSSRPPEAQGLSMLDFHDDANIDFREFDFSLLDHWNFEANRHMAGPSTDAEEPAGITEMRSALNKMWTESPWKWTPGKTDNCYTEQSNLPLPSGDAHGARDQNSQLAAGRVVKDTLLPSCRDKILGVVLGTCRESHMVSRVASSFPSANMLDSWINLFLASHLGQVSSWIHYPSFSLNSQGTEWLATAAAAGALLTPVPAWRRFGLALQEAIRIALPEKFEEDNRTVAEIGKVQTLMLVQDIGLWSGNRRKMEIAECHLAIPIAMMRYRGKFSRSMYPDIAIHASDEGEVLEEKWKRWYQLESWKRLAFHAYVRDAQISMTQLNNPSMSYAELTLPLPCSKELWYARSADEFKTRYLEMSTDKRSPSLGDLFRDVGTLHATHRHLDLQFTVSTYLHGFWSLIWEYCQLASIHQSPTCTSTITSTTNSNMTLLLSSRRHDLLNQLTAFHQLIITNPAKTYDILPESHLLLHVLFLNLHLSLPDMHLFTGKEGEDQARRVYPALQRWAASRDARQAMWHAAQVLRWASLFPRGRLRAFWSVGVCHAALGIWTYGVVNGAANGAAVARGGEMMGIGLDMGVGMGRYQQQQQQQQQQHRHQHQEQQGQRQGPVVYLDGGEETAEVRAWVEYAQGRPAIRGLGATANTGYGDGRGTECLLEDPRACMEVAQEILKANIVGVWETLPPLNENIIVVLKQLEKAAGAVAMR